jgi:predicted deacetylase
MPDPQTTLVFRYDDYAASLGAASAERDAIERRFLAAFVEAGIPLTVGVVPNWEGKRLLDDDRGKLAALRELVAGGRVEPALHGLTHRATTPEGVRRSEFAGLPPEQQAERLRTGKALLEDWLGQPVTSFIPPWNTFDEATLTALAELGFTAYSAALSELQRTEPVVSVPHTAGLGDLRRVLPWLARRGGRAFVVCMFHHFSFTDCSDALARQHARVSLAELPALLAWCQARPGIEFASVDQVAARNREVLADGRLDEARERWHLVYRWRRTRVVGRVVQRLFAPLALIEPGGWERGDRWLRRLGNP